MRSFAALYARLDGTSSLNGKVEAMREYFEKADHEDSSWALFFLSGRRLKRFVSPGELRAWVREETKIPDWLFEECRASVGDTAECCALLIDARNGEQSIASECDDLSLSGWMNERILPLAQMASEDRRVTVCAWWRRLPRLECYVICKLITGSLRVGVSRGLAARALASLAGLSEAEVARRLMVERKPTAADFAALLDRENSFDADAQPYPFFLASPLEPLLSASIEGICKQLGSRDEWLAERKWDGIRAQLIKRAGEIMIWTRGEELATDRYPEIAESALAQLPDGVAIDGEILAYLDGRPMPFASLQTRIGRKKLSAKALSGAPVAFMAYDLLELDGADLRESSLRERREALIGLLKCNGGPLLISQEIDRNGWEGLATERDRSRDLGVEGLMLKRWSSPYRAGRRRGDWWKWKIDPRTIDAVLMYAQAGSGRRANLFTDYTFGVWKAEELVPVAKAYSGLDDKEIATLDSWIRKNARDRFGPVRAVPAELVFEIAFEGVQESGRHKAGVALRFPRILRARPDKKPPDADTVDSLRLLIAGDAARSGIVSSAAAINPVSTLDLFSWSERVSGEGVG